MDNISTVENKKVFSSNDTKIIKGIAIILMLMHHLWPFEERIAGGELKHLFTMFGDSSLVFFGLFGKICVSLFFFLGGYGIYIQSKKKNFNIIANIKKLYLAYWKVFIIFIPIGFIFFSNQIAYTASEYSYAKYLNFNWTDILKNFFAFSSSLNGEWWFIASYIFAILSFPIVKMIFENRNIKTNIVLIIIFSILMTNVFPTLGGIKELGYLNNNYLYRSFFCQNSPFIACFWMGMLFAKENLIIRLKELISENINFNILTDLIIVAAVVFLRQKAVGSELDILYVPILIIASLDLLCHMPQIRNVLAMLGRQSTNMWLIHSFYCYYFYPFVKMTIALKWGVPCLIVLIIMTYVTSLFVDAFWKYIGKIYNYLKYKFLKIKKVLE